MTFTPRSFDLALETDAYHLTRSQLLLNPMEYEQYVLYARRGGPQVVSDLALTLQEILASKPTLAGIERTAAFWLGEGIPFPVEAFRRFAQMDHMPISVRGVRDGEVLNPGDPVAVVSGPAALVAVLEALLESDQHAAMQVGANFLKTLAATGGDNRLFEVGLRAATVPEDHYRKLRTLKRLGLRFTSSGRSARDLGLKPIGTMGHNYTQRFQGPEADYLAFNQAVTRMLRFREEQGIERELSLLFLLDTRSTLRKGLPAAMRVLRERSGEIAGRLRVGVRLDSGDMRAQLREVIRQYREFDAECCGIEPFVVVESGLTARDIVDYEAIARELGFSAHRLWYGLGNYYAGAMSRDTIGLVYKISEFGGDLSDNGARVLTMKFGDEPDGGKSSYPGNFDLWESPDGSRLLAFTSERRELLAQGLRDLFIPIVANGQIQAGALRSDEEVQSYAFRRWMEVTGGYTGDGDDYTRGRRPGFSPRMAQAMARLRAEQLEYSREEVVPC